MRLPNAASASCALSQKQHNKQKFNGRSVIFHNPSQFLSQNYSLQVLLWNSSGIGMLADHRMSAGPFRLMERIRLLVVRKILYSWVWKSSGNLGGHAPIDFCFSNEKFQVFPEATHSLNISSLFYFGVRGLSKNSVHSTGQLICRWVYHCITEHWKLLNLGMSIIPNWTMSVM